MYCKHVVYQNLTHGQFLFQKSTLHVRLSKFKTNIRNKSCEILKIRKTKRTGKIRILITYIKMEEIDQKPPQFHEMNLDDRILKAIAKLGWCEPTLIQQKAIPFILDGKDVLAKGRTGSGKTGAFAIPVIQKILDGKKSASEQSVKALLLAPSRELAGNHF